MDKQMNGIPWIEGFEHGRVVGDVYPAENAQCQEPQEHHGTEPASNLSCAKTLDYEYRDDYYEHDGNHGNGGGDGSQALDGGGDGDGRCDDAVGHKGCGADGSHGIEPFSAAFLHQGIEREDSTLAAVVGAEGYDDVFDGGLDCQGPEDARHGAEDIGGIKALVGADYGFHDIKRGCADIAEDDAECDKEAEGRDFF